MIRCQQIQLVEITVGVSQEEKGKHLTCPQKGKKDNPGNYTLVNLTLVPGKITESQKLEEGSCDHLVQPPADAGSATARFPAPICPYLSFAEELTTQHSTPDVAYQCGAERKDHLPRPAGNALPNAVLNAVGYFRQEGSLLAYDQLVVNQDL
ncbi:mitochondrial enolase superfamily member 1 [Grus japonensis]|uniref:Mitochondrial enolase superfamily member 1 n=1 Tax=Grus japonensis TaxID=30415 RepID=A0ABC9VX61_GRUJA